MEFPPNSVKIPDEVTIDWETGLSLEVPIWMQISPRDRERRADDISRIRMLRAKAGIEVEDDQ